MDANEPRYVSTSDAARILGICQQTVYRLLRTGELPAVRIGRVHRIPVRAIERLAEATR